MKNRRVTINLYGTIEDWVQEKEALERYGEPDEKEGDTWHYY